MNLTNELAKQRNRDAAERTLMAWIRTCLSLISFGFGLDKIIAAIDRATATGEVQVQRGVQLVAGAFVITGILAMAGATIQYRRELRRLQHNDYVYRDKPQLAAATAVLITLIGVVALLLVAFGAGP
jgi:putative membrane protein